MIQISSDGFRMPVAAPAASNSLPAAFSGTDLLRTAPRPNLAQSNSVAPPKFSKTSEKCLGGEPR